MSTVPDQVTTYNLEEEAAACDREEEEVGPAKVHREVEVPAVGSLVEEPHVDGHQEEEAPAVGHRAMERLAQEVAAYHGLLLSTAIPVGVHRNFPPVGRRNFLLVEHHNFPLVVHRNFLLVVHLAEAARPAVRILVDLACLAPVEVVRS